MLILGIGVIALSLWQRAGDDKSHPANWQSPGPQQRAGSQSAAQATPAQDPAEPGPIAEVRSAADIAALPAEARAGALDAAVLRHALHRVVSVVPRRRPGRRW